MHNVNYFIEMVGAIVILAIALINSGGFSNAVDASASLFTSVSKTLQGR